MTLARALVLCLLAASVPPVAAAEACTSPRACLEQIAAAQRRVRSVSARFVQTKHVSLLAEPIETTGQFVFRHPDNIVWKVDEPPFEINLQGGKLQLPPGEEASLRATMPSMSGMFAGMSAMFTGDAEKVLSAFDVDARHDGNDIVIDLKPKGGGERRIIAALRLKFGEPSLELREIHIEEAVGDSLDIVFHDTQRTLASE